MFRTPTRRRFLKCPVTTWWEKSRILSAFLPMVLLVSGSLKVSWAYGETTDALAGLVSGSSGAAVGSVCGVVQDQTGAGVAGAAVELRIGQARLGTRTGAGGEYCFSALGPGQYELGIQADGFRSENRQLTVDAGEAVRATVSLVINAVEQQVVVEGDALDAGSRGVSHTNVDASLIASLPSESVNAALSSVLTLATPGVAADSNGVFHPLGEHAETSFSMDGQPISDQQSRIFSNQISVSTIQKMEVIHGSPPAEFGGKTSLIVKAVTRSGLEAGRATGTVSHGYGTFGTATTALTLASGTKTAANFLALDGVNSHRFLDTSEFRPLHSRGNAENLFDRVDLQPNDATAFHLNLSASHSWFQAPNTFDQQSAGQDQRQRMTSFNLGLAYSRVIGHKLLLNTNGWIRQDRVNYYPTANLFSDQPATLSQARRLTNTGARLDISYEQGRHLLQGGLQVLVTPLSENFSTGLTDPGFNSPCVDLHGAPAPDTLLNDPNRCAMAGFAPNPSFKPGLITYDLTRGGTLLQFRGATNICEESVYIQDSIRFGRLTLNLGLRFDDYHGLSQASGVQPRVGIAYQVHSTGTVLRASYARVFLTPYNENLLLSSATGPGGLGNGILGSAAAQPLSPARRNQFNVGFEQRLVKKLSIDFDYFWKYTHGAYDFNVILNTPLAFPIQFQQAKIDGAMVRVSLAELHGFSAFSVLGHTRSRLFSPEIGGINFGDQYAPVARPDHDQAFQQTTHFRYTFKPRGLWIAATWRFDSGLVVVGVPDYPTALTLTGDEQQQIGLYCGAAFATVDQPLRSCSSGRIGATRIHIVPTGTFDPDRNPSRITPRHLFDIAVGADRIWKKERYSVGAKVTVVNMANRIALYNFLSSFSGTHFVTPRTLQAEVTLRF